MDTNELKKMYMQRDRSARAITTDGKFRAAAIINTNTAREAMRRHQLDALSGLLLSRTLAAASLMASFLKGEERIIIELMGNGVVKKIFAEALQLGEVRGYVEHNSTPENTDTPLGIGLLRVTRVLYGKFEPVSGVVALQKANVTTDLASYLTQSEQIPSAVRLDVDMSESGEVFHSAGIIIQAMPDAGEAEIMKVQNSIIELGSLAELAAKGYQPDEILRQIMPSETEIINKTPVDFFCRCSLDRFKSILLTLGLGELQAMRSEGQRELVCQYCNNHYQLSDEDFDGLIEQLQAQRN